MRGGPALAVPLLEDDGRGTSTLIQIWGGWRAAVPVAPPGAAATRGAGFSDFVHDGVRYRVYSLQTPRSRPSRSRRTWTRATTARDALALRAVAPGGLMAPVLMAAL